MLKILHFSDAHIDIANHGKHDPASGLPVRVQDFLKALDTIVDAAIAQKVDLVLFAGDAYKDRTPVPTFMREWDKRILRLSRAGIPTVLLVGNHDLSPATGRAHAMQEFESLDIPNVKVISKPLLLKPEDLFGLPVQIIAIPWIARSSLMAVMEVDSLDLTSVNAELEERLTVMLHNWLAEEIDPTLPVILTAHASVQGAVYGGERSVMLGNDLVLPGSLVRDPRFDYVALGHIHKAQNLNEKNQPPVIYPGSIERVDFNEAKDDKFFVIADIEKHKAVLHWHKLDGRRFIDRFVRWTTAADLSANGSRSRLLADDPAAEGMPDPEVLLACLKAALPSPDNFADTYMRLVLEYPRDWDPLIDEAALRVYCAPALEFHFVRRPLVQNRARINPDGAVSSLSPLELLDLYWTSTKAAPEEIEATRNLASDIIATTAQTGAGSVPPEYE